MRADSDQRTDDRYDRGAYGEDETHGPYDDDDPYEEDRWSTWYNAVPFGWPSAFFGRDVDDEYGDRRYGEDEYHGDEHYPEDDSWWEEGLITLLLVVGVILFIIPEPVTSTIGIFLIGLGVLGWLFDWAT